MHAGSVASPEITREGGRTVGTVSIPPSWHLQSRRDWIFRSSERDERRCELCGTKRHEDRSSVARVFEMESDQFPTRAD